jgi:hypothetical protein
MNPARTVLVEDNIISLRTAIVFDDGVKVNFRLMPVCLDSAIPTSTGKAPKDYDWVSHDNCYLYRHVRSEDEEKGAACESPWVDQFVRPVRFENSPKIKLLWADSGNTVALYLDGEPWAFIYEETHTGYSKGVLEASAAMRFLGMRSFPIGKPWDQQLFERIFIS